MLGNTIHPEPVNKGSGEIMKVNSGIEPSEITEGAKAAFWEQ